jgi:mono/diheme cytochrome c family protein
MVRWSAIPFSHQEDRYMLRKTLLTVSVLFATAACGQSQAPAAPAPATAATPAAAPAPAATPAPTAGAAGKLYTVVEGYKVDAETMKGFRTWRAAACDRCHGANQEGMVGPSLVASLKTLTKEEFVKTVRDGRLEKGMQSFGTSPQVMENMNQLYAYLKGRSDGAITRSKVEPMP